MYIASSKDNYKLIKKEIGVRDGKKIYRDLLEVVCRDCGKTYYQNISFNEINKINLICPYCRNIVK